MIPDADHQRVDELIRRFDQAIAGQPPEVVLLALFETTAGALALLPQTPAERDEFLDGYVRELRKFIDHLLQPMRRPVN